MIQEYEFGRIVVGQMLYEHDIMIHNKDVKSWWRLEGHRVDPCDLQWIIECNPQSLVIGTGYNGLMNVPAETIQYLKEHGVEVLSAPSNKAIKIFNDLCKKGEDVALAIHLTC